MNKKLLPTSIISLIISIGVISYIQFDSWRTDLTVKTALPKYLNITEKEINELSHENLKKVATMYTHQYPFTEKLLKKSITTHKTYVFWLSVLVVMLSILVLIIALKSPNKRLWCQHL